MTESTAPLLEVADLSKHFAITGGLRGRTVGWVSAVDGVSFTIGKGETLGLVGESGCGKSTVGRTILGLVPPTGGSVRLDGEDLATLDPGALRARRRRMQIVFQDPFSSLNPRMSAEAIVAEPLVIHQKELGREGIRARAAELFDQVGLPRTSLTKYPHEFSGGQRQRIGIARALALKPDLIVCDEAVSALDVSVQAQVINLLEDLQQLLGVSYLFISHDLAVVEHISQRVAVMYLGRIVELAPSAAIFAEPLHPYTQALLSAIPEPDPDADRSGRIVLSGDLPSPINPPAGCRFHTRCPFVMERCRTESPALRDVKPGHTVACHLHDHAGG